MKLGRGIVILFLLAILAKPLEASAETCYASTVDEINACLEDNNTIIISEDIVFTDTEQIDVFGKANIIIMGVDSDITLSESQARVDAQNAYYMIRVRSSNNITIKDLNITSPVSTAMCRYGGTRHQLAPCTAPISLESTTMTFIDNVTIDAQKTFQMVVHAVYVVYITNSTFMNAATFGIWLAAMPPSHNYYVHVTDNNFFGAGANGILIHNISNFWLGNNYFLGNHKDNQYFGYGGGQVLIEDNGDGFFDTVVITGNIIDEGGSRYASGIELADFAEASAANISINYNLIKNHRGNNQNAIYIGPRLYGSQVNSIEMKGNTLSDNDNDILLQNHVNVNVSDNFHQHGLVTSTANFSDTAKTCRLLPGNTACNVLIKWRSTNVATDVYVRSTRFGANRTLFSRANSGQQNSGWIDVEGVQFELVSEKTNQLYATINVKAVP